MSLNLEPIAAIVERYMMDQVRVYREVEKIFDDFEGVYTNVQEDIYEGKAFVATNATAARGTVGSDPVSTAQYEIGIPLAAMAQVLPMDYIVVVASLYDPELVGKVLRVIGVNYSTFSVHRRIQANLDDTSHGR